MFYRVGYRKIEGKTYAILWEPNGEEIGRMECLENLSWIDFLKKHKGKFSDSKEVFSKTIEVSIASR